MEEIQLFIEILLLFIGVYLVSLKSYLSEKGKSAILKEDIVGLTYKIESVKKNV